MTVASDSCCRTGPVEVQLLFTAQPPNADAAVVFVHGIAGHHLKSWGPDGLPGTFLTRLSADLPHVAVITASYPADMDSVLENEELTLDRLVCRWAEALSESILHRYRTVAIVGYCLGGLLTTMAIRQRFAENEVWSQRLYRRDVRLIVFLVDTLHELPKKEERKEGLLGLKTALACESAVFHTNAVYWQNQFALPAAEQLLVGAFALISDSDSFITSWCPHAHLPASRVYPIGMPHEELTKPPSTGSFSTYDIVLDRLRELI